MPRPRPQPRPRPRPRITPRAWLLASCACLALVPGLGPRPAAAQDAGDDGEGFLTRTLQNALSSDGMEVDITGFEGALSSRATMDRLTIADEDGIWLDLRDATLDWTRSALLRGRLEVNTLSAESIVLTRLPESEPAAPTPEAPGFSIPDLPVSVDIGELRIGRFEMGEAVIGQPATLSLDGAAALADGALDTALSIERLDRPGTISIEAAFSPEEETLAVDVTASEPEGGLVASLMDLPGRPSVELAVSGTGPLDAYDATLELATDGQERLSGKVSLRGRDDGGREFTADLGGDLTALMAPDYRDFLGTEIGLTATGTAGADGALDLQMFRLASASVNLEGRLALDDEGAPQSFALDGLLASPEGADRLDLPFGDGLSVASGRVTANFDRAESDDMTAHVEALAPRATGFSAEALTLDLAGPLPSGEETTLRLDLAADGLSAEDPAVARALGSQMTGGADITFGAGPVAIENLQLQGPALALQGRASYAATEGDGGADGAADPQAGLTLEARADVAELAAFAPLTGLDLAGRAALDLTAEMQLPAGTGRITATGRGEDLRTGIAQADALLTSPAELSLDVTRDETGITLSELSLGTDQLRLTGNGRLASDEGQITYDLALADANLLTGAEGAPSPLELEGAITRTPDAMTITAAGGGDRLALGIAPLQELLSSGIGLDLLVTLPDDGPVRLDRARVFNDALDLAASGPLAGAESEMAIDLSARLENSGTFTGAQAGPLTLSGQVTSEGEAIRATLSGGGDALGTGIAQLDALLDGPTRIAADVTARGGRIRVTGARLDAPGLGATASGLVAGPDTALDLALDLPDSGAPFGASAGPLSLSAEVAGTEAGYRVTAQGEGQSIGIGNPQLDALFAGQSRLSARIELPADGPIGIRQANLTSTALRASASGQVDGSAVTLDFDASLDDVARLAEGFNGPLTVTGSVAPGDNGALRLDARASGPAGSDATVSGLVARPDGSVDLAARGSAPLGLANPFIAPRSVAGLARFDLSIAGQPALSALSGQVTISDGRLIAPGVNQVVEGISGTVQLASGEARVDLAARPSEGGRLGLAGPVTLTPPFRAGLGIDLADVTVTRSGLATTQLDGRLDVTGPLTGGGGQIAGRIGLTETEIRVPSGGFGGQEPIPEMTHRNEPAASRAARARAGLTGADEGASVASSGAGGDGGLGLDIRLVTDSSVFIRGRGLDAELRGELAIGGTTSDPRPVGQFDLVRGRLSILTKRLELDEGQLRLAGGFEPLLNFVATSESGSYTYTIGIDGTASDPQISFSSSPGLPEDEILSRLFFDRPLSQLSAVQAAQLAAAVAQLTGQGGTGALGRLRENTGLDNLDVATDADGQASLTAGKYLNENVYTETEITGSGGTSFSLNLDLTDNIRARGSVETDGATGLGVFFEKDY